MNPAGQPPSEEKRRRSPRSRVFLSATLEWPDGILPVVLRDLSEHGALIEGTGPIANDTEVLLRRNNLEVKGHVAWVRGRAAGIAFSRQLKAEVVMEHISRPMPLATQAAHRRPGVTTRGMSAEEQRWANEMTGDPKRRGRD